MPFGTPVIGDISRGVLDHSDTDIVKCASLPECTSFVARVLRRSYLTPVRNGHWQRRYFHEPSISIVAKGHETAMSSWIAAEVHALAEEIATMQALRNRLKANCHCKTLEICGKAILEKRFTPVQRPPLPVIPIPRHRSPHTKSFDSLNEATAIGPVFGELPCVLWSYQRFYPFGISTILPITPPLPSNSCACPAWQRGNRCAINGLIFFCSSKSNSVSRSWRNHAGFSRISHWIL